MTVVFLSPRDPASLPAARRHTDDDSSSSSDSDSDGNANALHTDTDTDSEPPRPLALSTTTPTGLGGLRPIGPPRPATRHVESHARAMMVVQQQNVGGDGHLYRRTSRVNANLDRVNDRKVAATPLSDGHTRLQIWNHDKVSGGLQAHIDPAAGVDLGPVSSASRPLIGGLGTAPAYPSTEDELQDVMAHPQFKKAMKKMELAQIEIGIHIQIVTRVIKIEQHYTTPGHPVLILHCTSLPDHNTLAATSPRWQIVSSKPEKHVRVVLIVSRQEKIQVTIKFKLIKA